MENKLATYDGKLGLSRNLALPEEGKDIEWLNDELAKMEGRSSLLPWSASRTEYVWHIRDAWIFRVERGQSVWSSLVSGSATYTDACTNTFPAAMARAAR